MNDWQDGSRSLSISASVRWRLDGDGVVVRVEDPRADVQRNGLLDGLHLWIEQCRRAGRVRLELPRPADGVADGLATLRDALGGAVPLEFDPPLGKAPNIGADTAGWYADLLARDKRLKNLPPLAARLEDGISHPSFSWYATLNGPVTGRIDGLVVCRLHAKGGKIGIGGTGLAPELEFTEHTVEEAAAEIRKLADARATPGHRLHELDREHRLEGRVLRGAVEVRRGDGTKLEVALKSSQFPARWAVGGRARYLDVLMRDGTTPWAVELKIRSGGAGQYLRHGVGQVALYRAFIRQAADLHPYLEALGLKPADCRAAVAFPKLDPAAPQRVAQVRALGELFDVEIIELAGD